MRNILERVLAPKMFKPHGFIFVAAAVLLMVLLGSANQAKSAIDGISSTIYNTLSERLAEFYGVNTRAAPEGPRQVMNATIAMWVEDHDTTILNGDMIPTSYSCEAAFGAPHICMAK